MKHTNVTLGGRLLSGGKKTAPAGNRGLATTIPAKEMIVMTESQSSPARPTSVYKYYDANDLLLYVGITSRGARRQDEHNAAKEWWKFVSRQLVEHYPSRPHAAQRERALIRTYRPPFNVMHNPDHAATKAAYLSLATKDEKVVRDLTTALVRNNGKSRFELDVERIGSTLILRSLVEDGARMQWLDTDSRDLNVSFFGAKGAKPRLDRMEIVNGLLVMHVHCRKGAERCTGASVMLRMPNGDRRRPTVKRVDLRAPGGAV